MEQMKLYLFVLFLSGVGVTILFFNLLLASSSYLLADPHVLTKFLGIYEYFKQFDLPFPFKYVVVFIFLPFLAKLGLLITMLTKNLKHIKAAAIIGIILSVVTTDTLFSSIVIGIIVFTPVFRSSMLGAAEKTEIKSC